MFDQLHHATNMSSNVCASETLFETITASSANCNHEQELGEESGRHMYPSEFKDGFFNVCISVLKQRLNNNGEHGSPCNTPFVIPIRSVQSFPRAI
jgi:hypothetical protein